MADRAYVTGPGCDQIQGRIDRHQPTGTGEHPEQLPMAGGLTLTSKGPLFHLIPTIALERLAARCELGVERKGDKAWNAVSNNQACLLDRELAIERCSHIIHHALKLRDKLVAGADTATDDDAAAIMWGGMYLISATEAQRTL
jgi:hypothetical protein